MRVSLIVLPLAIVMLVLGGIVALGKMSVQSAALSTQASIELLRIHKRVAALHQELTGIDHGVTRAHLDAVKEEAGVEDDARAPRASRDATPTPAPTAVPAGEAAPDFLLVARDR